MYGVYIIAYLSIGVQELIGVFAPHANHEKNTAEHELLEILSKQAQNELALKLEVNMTLHP